MLGGKFYAAQPFGARQIVLVCVLCSVAFVFGKESVTNNLPYLDIPYFAIQIARRDEPKNHVWLTQPRMLAE